MKQAFISYSRNDKQAAMQLRDDLTYRGISTWIDVADIPIGEIWSAEIERAIAGCPYFLLLLSPHSIASEYVKREYDYAIRQQKKVIPVMLAPCAVPDAVAHLQYVDLRDYRAGLRRLLGIFPADAFEERETIPTIRAALKSSNREVTLSALAEVSSRKVFEAFDLLLELLQDHDMEIRSNAVLALAELRDNRAMDALLSALHDPHFDVRSNAGWGLVYLGDQVIPGISEILAGDYKADAKEMARLVLQHIGSQEARKVLEHYKRSG